MPEPVQIKRLKRETVKIDPVLLASLTDAQRASIQIQLKHDNDLAGIRDVLNEQSAAIETIDVSTKLTNGKVADVMMRVGNLERLDLEKVAEKAGSLWGRWERVRSSWKLVVFIATPAATLALIAGTTLITQLTQKLVENLFP